MSYTRNQAILEECNYANDHRVRALNKRRLGFDESRMTIAFEQPECQEPGCCVEPYGTQRLTAIRTSDNGYVAQWYEDQRDAEGYMLWYITGLDDQGLGPLGIGRYDACEQLKDWLNQAEYDGPHPERHPPLVVGARFEVCPTCDGRGSHVNPSIDASGISSEDFRDDPDFYDDYFGYNGDEDDDGEPIRQARGMYDVDCYECEGRRVVPVPAWDDEDPEHVTMRQYLRDRAREAADDHAMRMAEMRMGA